MIGKETGEKIKYDLIVIGAGPGGYEAAIKAAHLGKKVALVEKDMVGGACLNRGCIPTKALMHTTHLLEEMRSCGELGLDVKEVGVDFEAMHERKKDVVKQLRDGIAQLLKANKIDFFQGRAVIKSSGKVAVLQQEKLIPPSEEAETALDADTLNAVHSSSTHEEMLHADNILIATGSVPARPPIQGLELPGVVSSNEILEGEGRKFSHLAIIGGGVIGVELACVYAALGTEVTILEAAGQILPDMEKELSRSLAMSLKKKGIVIHTAAQVNRVEQVNQMEQIEQAEQVNQIESVASMHSSDYFIKAKSVECDKENIQKQLRRDEGNAQKKLQCNEENTQEQTKCDEKHFLNVAFEVKGKEMNLRADGVLVATGRKVNIAGILDCDSDGGSLIETDRDGIVTDENFQASAAGIYAVGDAVSGNIRLAHVASAQGIRAVCRMFGVDSGIDMNYVPACIYTSPELATVGLSLEQAKQKGLPAKESKFLMTANGKSVISRQGRSFIKVVYEEESHRILGAAMLCARATDMISEFALAAAKGLTLEDMASVIRPHPTYAEGITEAVEAGLGGAIHAAPTR